MFAAKRYLSESSAEDVDDPGSDTDHYKHAAGAAAGDGYGQFKRARMSQDSVDSDHNIDHNNDNIDHTMITLIITMITLIIMIITVITMKLTQSASINKPGNDFKIHFLC